MEDLLKYSDYFYVVTFLWTFFEGETFVIFGGMFAQRGVFRIDLLIFCAWIGSFCGDQLYFFIGRRYGRQLIRKFPRFETRVNSALGWMHRYNTGFILMYRFIYGVRNVSSFALGMSELSWPRFLMLNFIGAGIWANSFAGFGYLYGEALGEHLADSASGFMIGVLLLLTLIFGIKLLLRWRRRQAGSR